MNPRIAVAEPQPVRLATATRGDSPRARRYSWALFATGLAGGGVAIALGASFPAVPPVVLLVVLVAIAGNQVALFPSEWSATAETAVLLAAVVGLAGDGAFLGPWVVALATGPLDVVHWRGRSFARMAYNSGTRMLAVLLAAGGFRAVSDASIGSGALRFALAALTASVLYTAVELVDYVGYERLRTHTAARVAALDCLFCDPLTVPLGMLGALAGWLAVSVGWWAAVLVLVPTFFVPELVLVRARRALPQLRSRSAVRRAFLLAVALCALAAVVVVAPLPGAPTLAGLAACALVVALDLRVDRMPVAPVTGVVVAGAMVVAPRAAYAVAVVVAVVATTTASLITRTPPAWWAPGLAALAATAAALVFDVTPTRVGALVAALVFFVLITTRRERLVWLLPIACSTIALAEGGYAIDDGAGSLAWGAAFVAVAVSLTGWGLLPWDSRVLARWGARRRGHRAMLVVAVVASLMCGVVAAGVDDHRRLWVSAASGIAAAAAAMAVSGVRQWRFVPRRRRRDAALVVMAALAALVAYPPPARAGEPWALAVLVVVLAAAVAVGWPIARRIDTRPTAPRAVQRMPDRRSASA